ncbi:hypothetical protein D3C71_77680 [compost metagenome]
MKKLLSLQQSLGNPEWLAAHTTELRAMFPLDLNEVFRFPAIANVIIWTGKLALLGVDPEDVATAFVKRLDFNENFTRVLIEAGLAEIVDTMGNVVDPDGPVAPVGIVGLRRRKPASFEIAAAQQQAEQILQQEPTDESKQLAGEFMSKLIGKS